MRIVKQICLHEVYSVQNVDNDIASPGKVNIANTNMCL